MNKGAIRNLTLAGAFWAGFALLVSNANAENVYANPVDQEQSADAVTVTTTPAMNMNTVPTTKEDEQVQTPTVEAKPSADADDDSDAKPAKSPYKSVDAINKVRSETESANNALLLQQIELDRLKAEQARINAIQKFGNDMHESSSAAPLPAPVAAPTPAPCGVGPCIPNAAPPPTAAVTPVDSSVALAQNDTGHANSSAASSVIGTSSRDDRSDWSLEKAQWSVSPVLGRQWDANQGFFRMQNIYTVGMGIDATIHPWVTAEGSFTYGLDQSNNAYFSRQSRNDYTFATGVKIGPNYLPAIRPYLYLGVGYTYQNYQLSPLYRAYHFNQATSTDSVFTDLGFGMDFKVNKNLSVGARGDYQFVSALGKGTYGARELNRNFGDQSNKFGLGASAGLSF